MTADVELWIFVTAACLFSCSVGSVATYVAVNWSRDRQEEADQQRRENAIEHGLKLAQENQRLEERISGDTPAVDDLEIDVPGFMADSGYRPPLATGGLVALSNPPVVVSEGLCTLPSPHHLGPCGWSNGDTVCGDPSAGTVTWPGQGPVDLCADHIAWARKDEDAPAAPELRD